MTGFYVALVHYPVLDRRGDTITTAVTNLDVHDIARSARTYDTAGYFVVTPIEAQKKLVQRILDHWRIGSGAERVPERKEALSICEIVPSIEDAVTAITEREGQRPKVWVTGARLRDGTEAISERDARERLKEHPTLVLFGTGYGLERSAIDAADAILPPIVGGGSYNHLSVRAAAAITIDRLRAPEPH
ncbi:MAG: RNA methyltransferase [Sandaracinaceae bacterium]